MLHSEQLLVFSYSFGRASLAISLLFFSIRKCSWTSGRLLNETAPPTNTRNKYTDTNICRRRRRRLGHCCRYCDCSRVVGQTLAIETTAHNTHSTSQVPPMARRTIALWNRKNKRRPKHTHTAHIETPVAVSSGSLNHAHNPC